MKCAATRLGEESHDVDDLRDLLRHLDVRTPDDALAIVAAWLDDTDLPTTRLILEELLGR